MGIILLTVVMLLPIRIMTAQVPGENLLKPFKVAIVIGDQWQDPDSYIINEPEPQERISGYFSTPAYLVRDGGDFHSLVIMLKSWGIPFDIIRLDQQYLERYMFIDMYNKPMYGTIIWAVNESSQLLPADYSIITEMVTSYGIGMIALSDRMKQPQIQDLLGLKYVGSWESGDKFTVDGPHFITAGLKSPFNVDMGPYYHPQRQQVEIQESVKVIVRQGKYAQVTSREYPSGGKAVWIGSDHNQMFLSQEIRTLLRRAITWTIGYNLYKTWNNEGIMIMDDPGSVQCAWHQGWQYAPLTEEAIEKYLIKPLLEHKAVVNVNFVPAFVNDSLGRLEPTWHHKFIDEFGLVYDNISGKRGYDKGIKLGVFEVMCHGFTHMQPDLKSEPTWFGSDLDKERSEVGWYREFGDTRRGGEIPAAEQLWRMKTSAAWLKEQFGVTPLEFCAGGGGYSHSYFNNTAKIAAKAGFGWDGWYRGYLGKDMVIAGWKFLGTNESPLIMPILPDGHDFGITREPEKFDDVFDQYPDKRFIGINEFIGYLHAGKEGKWDIGNRKLNIELEYDPHYCMDFGKRSTVWKLEFSDWLLKEMGNKYSIKVDGKNAQIKGGEVKIPVGTGSHSIEVSFK